MAGLHPTISSNWCRGPLFILASQACPATHDKLRHNTQHTGYIKHSRTHTYTDVEQYCNLNRFSYDHSLYYSNEIEFFDYCKLIWTVILQATGNGFIINLVPDGGLVVVVIIIMLGVYCGTSNFVCSMESALCSIRFIKRHTFNTNLQVMPYITITVEWTRCWTET